MSKNSSAKYDQNNKKSLAKNKVFLKWKKKKSYNMGVNGIESSLKIKKNVVEYRKKYGIWKNKNALQRKTDIL